MNHPLYYTPEEASEKLKDGGPSPHSIRIQAQQDPGKLGFPVSVVGTRIFIPRFSFDAFWGFTHTTDERSNSNG